ncbi:hypothetical protein AVEN_33513-1 [Araneus ventricosus]|uniref:Uncharacterized protein n=1 Tax=Araneus ventricosus TaxID=182803 RepID=A0A4Y2GQ72_ARAVE|nr:hypothetical protein AVEN_33513-1 [Araneus ventricosus]
MQFKSCDIDVFILMTFLWLRSLIKIQAMRMMMLFNYGMYHLIGRQQWTGIKVTTSGSRLETRSKVSLWFGSEIRRGMPAEVLSSSFDHSSKLGRSASNQLL